MIQVLSLMWKPSSKSSNLAALSRVSGLNYGLSTHLACHLFFKQHFIGTEPHASIYVLSVHGDFPTTKAEERGHFQSNLQWSDPEVLGTGQGLSRPRVPAGDACHLHINHNSAKGGRKTGLTRYLTNFRLAFDFYHQHFEVYTKLKKRTE